MEIKKGDLIAYFLMANFFAVAVFFGLQAFRIEKKVETLQTNQAAIIQVVNGLAARGNPERSTPNGGR